MAQSWRVEAEPNKKRARPLDAEALERLALHYVGRYATTRAKLRAYLQRKIMERGWDGPRADVAGLVERLSGLGYIDDEAFANARAASLARRGYGERRVKAALDGAGIDEADAAEAREAAHAGAWESALRFAERKRIGPFAAVEPDRAGREKALASMLRAGHPMDVARRLVTARPGNIPESDAL